ncbi:hypothetical protein GCM10011609_54810 [Lentzea pudingi]|uniref:Uncharacterized protein n=2 Tax=Lentzea pudingi TaxID=1789439 RepID=A0ABQ2IF31_9PSEU|nr:hypothetical protein GCM10011609_54810 [Lentzea pudingi]
MSSLVNVNIVVVGSLSSWQGVFWKDGPRYVSAAILERRRGVVNDLKEIRESFDHAFDGDLRTCPVGQVEVGRGACAGQAQVVDQAAVPREVRLTRVRFWERSQNP